MTMDNAQVVPQPVVAPATPAPEGGAPPAAVTPPTPSPEDVLNQKIAEAVAKALTTETEKSRREIQSAKDKAMAEVVSAQRRAKFAESTMDATRKHIQTLDPEVAKDMELAEFRAKEQGRLTMEQEEAIAKQQAEFHQQFHGNLTQFIIGLGVDPADKRIDWAGDAPNYLDAQRRVLDSVSKIQKENVQTMQTGLEKRLKDLEGKVKGVAEEANSVNTAASPGVVAGSNAEFLKKFGAGEIPYNKENKERYEKIQKSYE